MAQEIVIEIDTKKMIGEFLRMISGEIEYNPDYLTELVEVKSSDGKDIHLGRFQIVCGDCDSRLQFVRCPECQVARRNDCSICDGLGGWLECPTCDEDIDP